MKQDVRRLGMAVAAAVLAALALGAAQSYAGFAWLALLAFLPVCLVLEELGFLGTWAVLAVFGAIHTLITAHWIRDTAAGFGWFLAAAVAYQVLITVLPAAGVWFAGRRRASEWLLLLPALWTLMELGTRRLFFGVSWALVGLPLADYPPLSQIASVAGPEALSFLAIAASVALAMACRKRISWPAVLQGALLVSGALVFGMARTAATEPVNQGIAVVQPMLPQQARWDKLENRPPLLARLNRLIDRAAQQRPRLIVLPEAALPGLVRYEPDLAAFATGAVQRTGVPLLFGSVDRDEEGRYYNAAIMIGTDGTDAEYRKRRLVPFAEHTPWPFHYQPPEGWVQFTPGTEATRVRLDVTTSFAVAMCLEDTYPDMAREYAGQGADLMIALVNTESFKESNQALAHLRRARLTAIAAGLPVLRAANSGISCSIDAHGRVVAALPPNREEAAVLPVSAGSIATFYGTWGDAGVVVLLCLLAAVESWWLRARGMATAQSPDYMPAHSPAVANAHR
jgi:apolipoprotein N-acyltransferase